MLRNNKENKCEPAQTAAADFLESHAKANVSLLARLQKLFTETLRYLE